MSSWRSRFRKTKTPDSNESKQTLNSSKNTEDPEHQKTWKSRFLRRSKHDEGPTDRPRPRSAFLDRTSQELNNDIENREAFLRNINEPPSVQEILDRNRRERGATKSPRHWRKILGGEKSERPSGMVGRIEHSTGGGDEQYSHRDRNRDHNYNNEYESRHGGSESIDDASGPRRARKHSSYRRDESTERQQKMENGDTRTGRRTSATRRQKSLQGDDTLSIKSDSSFGGKAESSRSASPYDNVSETSRKERSKRRDRRPRSLYIEEKRSGYRKDYDMTPSYLDKPTTPRRERRQRLRRSESQDTACSEKSNHSQALSEQEPFVLRKPRAVYPTDDGNDKRSWSRNDSEVKAERSPRSDRRREASEIRRRDQSREYRKDGRGEGWERKESRDSKESSERRDVYESRSKDYVREYRRESRGDGWDRKDSRDSIDRRDGQESQRKDFGREYRKESRGDGWDRKDSRESKESSDRRDGHESQRKEYGREYRKESRGDGWDRKDSRENREARDRKESTTNKDSRENRDYGLVYGREKRAEGIETRESKEKREGKERRENTSINESRETTAFGRYRRYDMDPIKVPLEDEENRNGAGKRDKIDTKENDGMKNLLRDLDLDQKKDESETANRKQSRGSRTPDDILGATSGSLETQQSSELKSPTEIINEVVASVEEVENSFNEWKKRFLGRKNEKKEERKNILTQPTNQNKAGSRSPNDPKIVESKIESGEKKTEEQRESDYKSYVEESSYNASQESSVLTKRESFAKTRPKSLYDGRKPIDFTDSLSKFKQISKEDTDLDRSSSVWEKYKPRNDHEYKQNFTTKVSNDDTSEADRKWRRPKSMFMVEDEKKDSAAYRGNWSVSVPKKPSHLMDFSMPDETSYNWRKSKTESVDAADDKKKSERASYRRRESQQQTMFSDLNKPEQKAPAFEITVSEPTDERPKSPVFVDQSKESMLTPSFASNIAVLDEEDEGNKENIATGADTVVRRRKKEHAPPARPSSFYYMKEETSHRPLSSGKSFDNDDDDDDDLILAAYSRRKSKTRPKINLDSEDIKTGLRKKSAVERRLRSKHFRERPKSVNLADVFAVSDGNYRGTSYGSRVKAPDPLRDTVDDVKRQFERLLRRTEGWKYRTESLDTRANALSTSYRSLNRAITGIRDESEDVHAVFDDVVERLTVNDSIGYPDTEEEWRKAFDAERLLAKATTLLDYQKRNPKPEFYYSESESEPESPGTPFYDMPEGIPWYSPKPARSKRLSSSYDYLSSRNTNDYLYGQSSRSYSSYKPSLDLTGQGYSSTTRFSPTLNTDAYSRRKRIEEYSFDYKRDNIGLSSSSSSGRIIPETAV
eukprot:Seg160.5 transcript_id=Seg160.5/GoldUCD/mRNA.D3Y31 product="hypothetical protein" protein_id=Seg160.5/GoldUCD/D3Y31